MSSKKGLLFGEPEVIGFMGPEELFLSPIVFPVGINVTSFLLACFKIAKSKSLLFACSQDTFFKGGGGMDFCIKDRGKIWREIWKHIASKYKKVTARASFRGMSCWTPRKSILSVNEKDIGFEVPSETGQANLAPPTSPRVCYISVPWVPLSLRPTTASRGWKIKSKEEENKSCQIWKIEGVRAKLIWSESLRPGKK